MTCTIDRWTAIWGDPLLPATLMMICYAMAAWLAWRVTKQETGRERVLWVLGVAVLVLLFVNTHLDLHVLPGAAGRCLAKAQGWWEHRRTVQAFFIYSVLALIALTLVVVVVFFFRNLLRNLLFVTGFLICIGYLVLQGSGSHQTDAIGNMTVGPLPISAVVEIAGALLISVGALLKLSEMKRAQEGKLSWSLQVWLWIRGPMLGECCEGPNNFKLIRMCAAFFVMLSHAYVFSQGAGINGRDPISLFIGTRFGNITLAVFFVLSGFILASRFSPETRFTDWWLSRILRIFPALLFVLCASAYVMGPVVTTLSLSEYIQTAQTHAYVPANASLFFLQRSLPGVFETNTHPDVVNGSLWMLQYMILCYAVLFVLGWVGVLRRKALMAIFLVLFVAFELAVRDWLPFVPGLDVPLLKAWGPLLLPFVLGMSFFVWRDHIPLSLLWVLLLLGLCILTRGMPYYKFIFLLFSLYTAIFVAYGLKGWILRYNAASDYSYGTYLFGFPVQQACIALLGPMSVAQNMMLAVPVTVGLAVLSYHYVERPALMLKRHTDA